jgi:transposase
VRVIQADIDDGLRGGVTSDGVAEIQRLEQESGELKRANEILRRAASFLGAEPGRQHR